MNVREQHGDLRQLVHVTPCPECPFRKAAPAGWLGGFRVEVYRQPTSVGLPTTCHMNDRGMHSVNSRICAGSCAVIANSGVRPMEGYEEEVARVGKRDDCFADAEDFAQHHAIGDEWR